MNGKVPSSKAGVSWSRRPRIAEKREKKGGFLAAMKAM